MQLIDVPFSLSAEYPNRYNPDSLVPRIWRHYQIGQGKEGEKFIEDIDTGSCFPGEREGYTQ